MISSLCRSSVLRKRTWPVKTIITRSLANHSKYAYIALGSNIGNRIENIENACRALERSGLPVLRTSHLYETKPMYVENQDNFVNGACEISVADDTSSMELLAKLKEIENSMGRVKLVDKGPRNIDLDILLHGDESCDTETLTIPHKAMLEREFVLRPLCDLIPHGTHQQHPTKRYSDYLAAVRKDASMSSVTALGKHQILKAMDPERQTKIMSILNITPDSFSDGGNHSSDPHKTLPTVEKHIQNGAVIIDIGGYSTRPNASDIPSQEELSRVIPLVQAVREAFPQVGISIDTFRHEVAEAAVMAGADIVNDVSAGQLDPEMLPTVARLGCTYIAMHMRGNPTTMMSLNNYADGVVAGVGAELMSRVQAAEKAGIRKWRLVLDPGIGFAKNQAQNLEILRRLADIRRWPGLGGFPWMVGASRKGFIGRITNEKQAHERTWGTAAAVSVAVQGGADIVRVHDVAEMLRVTKMADAIWRVSEKSAQE